jgi:hypothetical protein
MVKHIVARKPILSTLITLLVVVVVYSLLAREFPDLWIVQEINNATCAVYDRFPSFRFPTFFSFGFADPNLVLFIGVVSVIIGIMLHRETI